ncbi:MAG: hypothetical protein QXL78_00960 [Methanocellales archaeon]
MIFKTKYFNASEHLHRALNTIEKAHRLLKAFQMFLAVLLFTDFQIHLNAHNYLRRKS